MRDDTTRNTTESGKIIGAPARNDARGDRGPRRQSDDMYKLYGTNLTGTCAVQAALAELDVPFERIEVSTEDGQHLSEDY